MIFDDLDEDFTAVKPVIKVIGVGGAGGNAVDRMIENDVRGVEFVTVNTDAQDLKASAANKRVLIGRMKTHGLGAGAKPEIGRAAALESEAELRELVYDADMIFIACGMGGGTGTGASPVIARCAKERGCLTVAIVTKPFFFEGPERMEKAVAGLEELKQYVDTLICIPNQRLLSIVDPHTPMLQAFREADNVLRQGVQGIAEIIAIPGLINVDFADVRTVMANKGTALMGIGTAKGENRAIEAARRAIHSNLLEVSIDGATSAIVNITSTDNLPLKEVDDVINEIKNYCDKNLNVIYGTAINNDLGDEIVVTVIATGYELKAKENGIEDLASEIFKNMSDTNIRYQDMKPDEDEMKSDSERDLNVNDLFYSKRLAKLKKAEEKKNKKDEKTDKKSNNINRDNLPDWLKR